MTASLRDKMWMPVLASLVLIAMPSVGGPSTAMAQSDRFAPVIDAYIRFAFAGRDELLKFETPPTVAVYCRGGGCASSVKVIRAAIPSNLSVSQSLDLTGDIEVLYYADDMDRQRRPKSYSSQPGEQLETELDAKCSLVRIRKGNRVTKLAIVVLEDAGSRANALCVLRGMLQGTGVLVRESYAVFAKTAASYTPAQFEQVVRGFSRLLTLHWAAGTQPGLDRATTRTLLLKQLKSGAIRLD